MAGFVVVIPSLQSGGAERVALNLAAGLNSIGQDVEVIVLDGRGPLRAEVDHRFKFTDLGRRRARTAVLPLLRRLRAGGPRIIVASQTHLNLLLCLLSPLLPRGSQLVLRAPLLREARGAGGPRTLPDRAVRLLYPRATLLVASSAAMADDLAAQIPANRRPRIVVLPNAVDVLSLRAAARKPERAPGKGRRIVTVSRLIARKRVSDLIMAFAAVAAPDDVLTVIGDGPEAGHLADLAERCGATGRVRFAGHLPIPAPVVAGADVLVTAALREGMPNAILEALAVGTPVLAPDDLVPVAELAGAVTPGGIRLFRRDRLHEALEEVTPSRVEANGPRPSLLPSGHRPEVIAACLLENLLGMGNG